MSYVYNAQGQVVDTDTGQIVQDPGALRQQELDRKYAAMGFTTQKTNTQTTTNNQTSQKSGGTQWYQGSNGNWVYGDPNTANNTDVNKWASDRLNDLNAAADKYASDLRATAQGDYDFAIKWLTKQHETALGTNDQETAKFFESVANSLEKQIGRIPYDYLTKTDQEKQDIANYMLDQNRAKEDQFQRDYQFKQQNEFNQKQQKEQTQETFNARGLSGSGLEKKQQQLNTTQNQLFNVNPQQRQMQLETDQRNAAIRDRQLQSTRTLNDLTTTYRRAGLDSQAGTDQSTELAQRSLAQRLAEISSQQELLKRQNVAQVGTELGSIYG